MNIFGLLFLLFLLVTGMIILFFKPFSIWLCVCACLVGMFLIVALYQYEIRAIISFPQIEIGASRAQVEHIMGKPDHVTDCAFSPIYNEAISPRHGCISEFWYLSTILPGAWQFSFDKEQKLIYKYRWTSY